MAKVPMTCCGVMALLGGSALSGAAPSPAISYATAHTVAVGAPERWDYLSFDADTHRLYLSHFDRVEVLDGSSGERLGSVAGIPGGTHGIGIAGSLGKGYTDDGTAGEVVVFDLHTLKVLRRVKTQPDADGIVVDPKTGHVFVINGDSASVSVLDPSSDRVIATVQVGGTLEFAVPDGRGKLYVNGAERRELVRIDTAGNRVDARWPIPACESPHGIAMDPATRRVFVSCVNQLLVVVDADSGALVAKLPIGRGTDAAAFDPQRQLIFSSNGIDGTVSVIRQESPQRYTVLADISTAITGRTMSIDPASGRLFVAAAAIDPAAPVPPRPDGRPGRPQPLPASLKVLYLDPKDAR
ncbi:MAG: YncE family protein [Proteobacteria bacterium]|nr:YncE family protein [Pseudomonadota bacterium]